MRPFSVKISGLVCVVSHLILLSTKNSKVFSYNFGPPSDLLVLPLIYCWPTGVRPFSVKISGLVCVVSHLILLSTKNSKVFSYNFGPPSDLLVLLLIYCWPTRLGKLLIRLKPPAIQSNGKVLWNTLQPIGVHSVLVTDFWKIPFGKRYCFVNLVQQNGIA